MRFHNFGPDRVGDLGCNFFDTAWAYGEGRSVSLRNLGVSAIDVQQLHVWDDPGRLRTDGKRPVADLKPRARDSGPLDEETIRALRASVGSDPGRSPITGACNRLYDRLRSASTAGMPLTSSLYSRRYFGRMIAALPLTAVRLQSTPRVTLINGVQFGIETFSFQDLPPSGDPRVIPTIVSNMRDIGLAECEIMSAHVEPFPGVSTGWWVQARRAPGYERLRDEARQWRLTIPMSYYAGIRRQFEDAGLRIYLYNVNFNETFTDAERERTFEAAKALGADGFSSSTVVSEARRLVPYAERHRMFVAMHNHNNLVDPDQFATPASFETALAFSPYFKVTLDIGHFTAANQDAVAFIQKHHARIVNIHVRDRERDNGPNRPFGQGHTPIREVLRLIRDERYPIRCYLEYEYGSFRSSVDEVKRCLEYCRQALA